MGKFLPSTYISGILVFILVIGSVVGMISLVLDSTTAPAMNDSDLKSFNSTFYVLNNVSDVVEGMDDQVRSSNSTDFGVFGVLNGLISGAWQVLRLMTASLSFMNGVFSGLTVWLGVPSFVVKIVLLIVTVGLIFGIYSAVFQREL